MGSGAVDDALREGGTMRQRRRVLAWALALAAAGACKQERQDVKGPVLTERRDAVAGGPSRLAWGEDCTAGQGPSCATAVCLKTGLERGRGHFCSGTCKSEADCPQEWSCRQVMPGPGGDLCIPPEGWVARAVGVRP